LSFAYLIALLDADPLHLPYHLGSHFDLVCGNDVAGGVEDHTLRHRGGVHGFDALYLYFRGRGDLFRRQPPATQGKEQQHTHDDRARGPFGRFRGATLGAIDLKILEFGVHGRVLYFPQRGKDLLLGGRARWEHASEGAHEGGEDQAGDHDLRRDAEIESHFRKVSTSDSGGDAVEG